MKTKTILLLFFCLLAAGGILLTITRFSPFRHAAPAPAAPQSAGMPMANVPHWPYPSGVHEPQTVDDNHVYHIAGSKKSYTYADINKKFSTVDWFPKLHPAPPAPVILGKKDVYHACGQCHLIDGRGKPDTADLEGLPVAYFLEQLADMRDGKRRGSLPHASVFDMIPVAKALDAADAQSAAEYFRSIKPSKSARIVETDMVPVTHPGPHNVQLIDPSGAKEPLGERIVEVPVDLDRTMLRDATSGFIAYVPTGSVERGRELARTGIGGVKHACVTCHGKGLRGTNEKYPPIAGRSPTALARELYDFKTGARDGTNAADMQAIAANLSDRNIVDVSAYAASLQP